MVLKRKSNKKLVEKKLLMPVVEYFGFKRENKSKIEIKRRSEANEKETKTKC